MKMGILIGILVAAVLLQISFLPALRPFDVIPNLVLVVVAAAALGGPIVQAMGMGIGGGIVLDLVSGTDFGLRTGLLAVAVILCAFARRSGLQLGPRVQILGVVGIVCSLEAMIQLSELVFVGGRIQGGVALRQWLGTMISTGVLGILLVPWIVRLARLDDVYGEVE